VKKSNCVIVVVRASRPLIVELSIRNIGCRDGRTTFFQTALTIPRNAAPLRLSKNPQMKDI